jgi:hypothetical protein
MEAPHRQPHSSSPWTVLLAVLFVAFGLSGPGLRAQCGMIPNECCPPESVTSFFSAPLAVANALMAQFEQDVPMTSPEGPPSSTTSDPGTVSLPGQATCSPDRTRPVDTPGQSVPNVSTYGGVEKTVTTPVIDDGLTGIASMYQPRFVVDGSFPAWAGNGTSIKGDLPRPDLDVNLLAGGNQAAETVQPRPGTVPGLYLLQVGDNFYHYGGPLESGANPQTTAVYAQSLTSEPDLVVLTNNLSSAQLWFFPTASSGPESALGVVEIRHSDGTVAAFESFVPYVNPQTLPGQRLWRVTSVRDPYDNVAWFSYNHLHQLDEVVYPSGMKQEFDFLPAWKANFPQGDDCIEVRYLRGGGGKDKTNKKN